MRWPSCRVRSAPPTAAPRPRFRYAPLGATLSSPPFGLRPTFFAFVPSALRWLATSALVVCGGSPAPAPPRPRPTTLAPPTWLASLRFTCGGFASGLAVGASALTDDSKSGCHLRLMAPWGGVLAAARFHRSCGLCLSALPRVPILWRRLVLALRASAPTVAVSCGRGPNSPPLFPSGGPVAPPPLPRSLRSRPATVVGASGDRYGGFAPSFFIGCRRPALNGRSSLSLLRPSGWARASLWSCRPAGLALSVRSAPRATLPALRAHSRPPSAASSLRSSAAPVSAGRLSRQLARFQNRRTMSIVLSSIER